MSISQGGNHKKCRWTRCPWNLVLSHVAQDMANSQFWGLLTQTLRNLGQQRALCHETLKVHIECGNYFPSFGRFERGLGLFWAKTSCFGSCFGAPNPHFWEGTSRLGAPAPGRYQ